MNGLYQLLVYADDTNLMVKTKITSDKKERKKETLVNVNMEANSKTNSEITICMFMPCHKNAGHNQKRVNF